MAWRLPFALEADGARADTLGRLGRERRVDGTRRQRLPCRSVEGGERGLRAQAGSRDPAGRGAARCRARACRCPTAAPRAATAPRRSSANARNPHCACSSRSLAPPLTRRGRERRQRRFRHRFESSRVEAQSFARRRSGARRQRAAIGRQERRAIDLRVVLALRPGQHERMRARTPVRDDLERLGHARLGCRAGHRELALDLDRQQRIDGHGPWPGGRSQSGDPEAVELHAGIVVTVEHEDGGLAALRLERRRGESPQFRERFEAVEVRRHAAERREFAQQFPEPMRRLELAAAERRVAGPAPRSEAAAERGSPRRLQCGGVAPRAPRSRHRAADANRTAPARIDNSASHGPRTRAAPGRSRNARSAAMRSPRSLTAPARCRESSKRLAVAQSTVPAAQASAARAASTTGCAISGWPPARSNTRSSRSAPGNSRSGWSAAASARSSVPRWASRSGTITPCIPSGAAATRSRSQASMALRSDSGSDAR